MLGYGVMAAPWFLAPVVGVRIPVSQPDEKKQYTCKQLTK